MQRNWSRHLCLALLAAGAFVPQACGTVAKDGGSTKGAGVGGSTQVSSAGGARNTGGGGSLGIQLDPNLVVEPPVRGPKGVAPPMPVVACGAAGAFGASGASGLSGAAGNSGAATSASGGAGATPTSAGIDCLLPPSVCIDDQTLLSYTNGRCGLNHRCSFDEVMMNCGPISRCGDGRCLLYVLVR